MSKVLMDKLNVHAKELAKEQNIDLTKMKHLSVEWYDWITCWFQAAKEIRDQFYDQGLVNSAKAMNIIITDTRKPMRDPKEQAIITSIIDVEELAE